MPNYTALMQAARDVKGWTPGPSAGAGAMSKAGTAASWVEKAAKAVHALQAAGLALAPIMPWMPIISGALEIFSAALNAYDLHKITELRTKLNELLAAHHGTKAGTDDAVAYALMRFNDRERRSATGTIFLIGSLINLTEKVYRSVTKRKAGTIHKEREKHAYVLWTNAVEGDPMAVAAVKLLITEAFWKEWTHPHVPKFAGAIFVYEAMNGWAP